MHIEKNTQILDGPGTVHGCLLLCYSLNVILKFTHEKFLVLSPYILVVLLIEFLQVRQAGLKSLMVPGP